MAPIFNGPHFWCSTRIFKWLPLWKVTFWHQLIPQKVAHSNQKVQLFLVCPTYYLLRSSNRLDLLVPRRSQRINMAKSQSSLSLGCAFSCSLHFSIFWGYRVDYSDNILTCDAGGPKFEPRIPSKGHSLGGVC